MAKKVNSKMILADINAGMDKHALMSKYGLSAAQFESAMRKLNEAGFLTAPQVLPPPHTPSGAQTPSRCPACGNPLTRGLEECPKCGVIFAKYHVVEEPPLPKDSSMRVPLPDLLKGEAVNVDQRSPLVRIGALAAFIVIIGVGAFFFFRSSSAPPRSSPNEPKAVGVTAPAESASGQGVDSEATESTEEAPVEGSGATSPNETTIQPETVEETSETAIALPQRESSLAEDQAAVPTAEKPAEQPNVNVEKTLDSLSQSMIQTFDRAVRQWTPDDFRRFADRARQTLDEVSADGLPDAIRESGENLILQLSMESPETATEAFRQTAALVRPELNKLSPESKNRFIKAAQEIKRDVEASINR